MDSRKSERENRYEMVVPPGHGVGIGVYIHATFSSSSAGSFGSLRGITREALEGVAFILTFRACCSTNSAIRSWRVGSTSKPATSPVAHRRSGPPRTNAHSADAGTVGGAGGPAGISHRLLIYAWLVLMPRGNRSPPCRSGGSERLMLVNIFWWPSTYGVPHGRRPGGTGLSGRLPGLHHRHPHAASLGQGMALIFGSSAFLQPFLIFIAFSWDRRGAGIQHGR